MPWTSTPPASIPHNDGESRAIWRRAFGRTKEWWEKPCGEREWATGWASTRPKDMPAEAWNFAPGAYRPGIPSSHTRGSFFADTLGESLAERWEAFTGRPLTKEQSS